MKKLYTLTLALLTALIGFAQVQNQPNMVRLDFNQEELDYTTYDWQTNWGIINRTIVWPDGKVSFAYAIATTENHSDRGTAISTYDANTDDWSYCNSRIEPEKTGFGSIARYGHNSIVVAAHTASELGLYMIADKDNITPECAEVLPKLDPTNDPQWPVIMTSGANRDIIHVVALGYSDNMIYYYRSQDGGQTWDKQNVILPYLTSEYGSSWRPNCYYWMETTDDNCLALVINNPWSDGMVLYSYDDGETWERKLFYQHPGINNTFDDWFFYPRWTSCIWGDNGELRMAYEFNSCTGEPGSDTVFLQVGGVAFWSESLPYQGSGQPFVMESNYIHELWDSSPYFQNPWQNNFPEYFGFLEEELENYSLHGDYNCGPVAMPILCKVPGNEDIMVAVFMVMDPYNQDEVGNYYFKLYASCSWNGGLSWTPQIHITDDFMLTYNEFVYPQVAVVGHTLIVVAQTDGTTGTYVQGDDYDDFDNYYIGLTYNLDDLLPIGPIAIPETEPNTRLTIYPNPAEGQINLTLNKNVEVKVSNLTGQTVMTMEGRVGTNALDISSLSSGIYFISGGNNTQKLVVK